MPVIDHRRHSLRGKPGPHLTQAGVELARRAGDGEFGVVPRYELVVTSTVPRAFETAIALGFAVDEQLEALSTMGAGVSAEYPWPVDIGEAAPALTGDGSAGRFAREQAALLRALAGRLSPDGAALVVSHGGIVEAGAVALLPDADHASWGPAIGYVEGIRLHFEGERCVAAELLRVPDADYRVLN